MKTKQSIVTRGSRQTLMRERSKYKSFIDLYISMDGQVVRWIVLGDLQFSGKANG